MKTKTIIILGLLLSIISCDDRLNYFNKTYEGLWAETRWIYKFKKDGTFKFITEGHYDFSEHSGNYIIKDSIMFLNPDTDWPMLDGVLKTRLRIMSSDCIRDFDNNYYCMTTDSINEFIEQKYVFNEKAVEVIDNLNVVKDEKNRISSHHKGDSLEFSIDYNGIIVVNRKEYHIFSLDRWTIEGSRRYLTFLVTKRPFEVYQHDYSGNKLTKVFNE